MRLTHVGSVPACKVTACLRGVEETTKENVKNFNERRMKFGIQDAFDVASKTSTAQLDGTLNRIQ